MREARRGYVIIEVLLAISSLLVIFGICVLLIHGLLKLDRGGRNHLAEVTTRERLARRFRLDVRAASGSKPGPGEAGPGDRLELSRPDGRVIDYRMFKGRLVREERDHQGRPLAHDAFRLPSGSIPRFQVRQENNRSFVDLELRPASTAAAASPSRLPRCEALLGKDLRFAGSRGAER